MPFRAEGKVKSHNQSQLSLSRSPYIIKEPLHQGASTVRRTHRWRVPSEFNDCICAGGCMCGRSQSDCDEKGESSIRCRKFAGPRLEKTRDEGHPGIDGAGEGHPPGWHRYFSW